MHLSDWIKAYVHLAQKVYKWNVGDLSTLYDTLSSCMLSIYNCSSAYDMEMSFFYIIGLLQCAQQKKTIPMTYH